MAGISREDSGVGSSTEGFSSGQQLCESGEALAEWRSSEQLENGIPSTSPPYWDTDDDDDFGRLFVSYWKRTVLGCGKPDSVIAGASVTKQLIGILVKSGPKPCELYGKYTWKIDKFSQINKRELRSNAFEVGGYKWYILIYPQGCDVCNHLSLFLCVANHDKLLPGWSHFAQFTIAVVNKDPKKSKYSDTLHRFWKKEHDWGWKKFMELSKVLDGFIDADNLIIKAQVQVISFCAFWLGIDQNARRRMSREKTDSILRVVVKHFFIEKEVTSTLVMDSLYSGLKALEGQAKSKNGRGKLEDVEDSPVPIVHIDKDMLILVDDVLLLLERAALEPLPPKDDKGPQNRMKVSYDGGSGEDMSKDSIERDERRLTELGRRTIEIFVLAHVFSKIEVAYQEAVALKRQEELIREEAAWLAETEQKAKRGAAEKEKKSKKKQGKQKRNNRKGKDKGRDEMLDVPLQESPADEVKDFRTDVVEPVPENPDTLEDVSDVSDSVDFVPEMLQPDSEDRDASPVNWDTDASEIHPATEASGSGVNGLSSVQNGTRDGNSMSAVDDSSSTCSTDSVPSVVTNGPYKGSLHPNHKSQKSPSRGRNQRGKETTDATDGVKEAHSRPPEPTKAATRPNDASGSCKAESEAVVHSLQDRIKELEKHMVTKVEEEVVSLRRELSTKDQVDTVRPPKEKATTVPASATIPPKNLPSAIQAKSASKNVAAIDPVSLRNPSSDIPQPTAPLVNSAPKFTEKPSVQQMPVTSRPLSAQINSGPRPIAPVASTVQTPPLLARSVSAAGRLGPDPSPATHNSVPQSYRNAIMGTSITSSSTGFTQPHSPRSATNPSQLYSQLPGLTSSPMFLPRSSDRMEPNSVKPSISFGMLNLDVFQNGRPQWVDCPERSSSTRSMHYDDPSSSQQNDVHNLGFYKPVVHRRLQDNISTDSTPACTSGRQTNHGAFTDEFPHLDIINDLLDDEHSIAKQTRASTRFQSFSNGPHHLNRQFSFPLDPGMSSNIGPSTSCRFERARSYHDDGLQHGYGSLSGAHFDVLLPDMIPQANQRPFLNEHVDGFLPAQWQMGGSDYSYLGMGNVEGDGYPYHVPDYSNLVCGVNGYTVFRPSNGH
ncbi:hypothetical protein RHSIM_Rhsim04G0189200 [Rhododendron simsii]|uniref:MATH domain-containing protein n=1 Tax=Rhododendron simsii TaxID=118357 RepID=A0A834LNA5_RHOSS|nr:hypothetical protein RHSIM_Rhsim04G0189200 [Rhododendron simsii]